MTNTETLETVPALWLAGFIFYWGYLMLAPVFRKTTKGNNDDESSND